MTFVTEIVEPVEHCSIVSRSTESREPRTAGVVRLDDIVAIIDFVSSAGRYNIVNNYVKFDRIVIYNYIIILSTKK